MNPRIASISSIKKQKNLLSNTKNRKIPIITDFDDLPIFTDIGEQKLVSFKEIDKLGIYLIPGKTLDGNNRYPAYKLEFDVFWALRELINKKESIIFSINELKLLISKKFSTQKIQDALSVLSTAKFQVINSRGEIKKYSYIKELCMPTRAIKGSAVFDDAIVENIKSGNYRQINVKKLLAHTTAGGRYLYQRMNMKFIQASENINLYRISWDKIIRDIHRKDELKIYKFRYLKTVARDLRDNGTINITEEQIKTAFSAKATKYSPVLHFPVSSDLISDIHDANIVAKAIRIEKIELASHIEKMGTDKGFISSAERKRREKQKYNQKKSYISDSKIQTNKID